MTRLGDFESSWLYILVQKLPKYLKIFKATKKHHFWIENCHGSFMGTYGNFGQLLIPTSGHTGSKGILFELFEIIFCPHQLFGSRKNWQILSTNLDVVVDSVWPDVGFKNWCPNVYKSCLSVYKTCPNVDKNCLQNIHSSFYIIDLFKKVQKLTIFRATFVKKFVAKNFKKSPNLATLARLLTLGQKLK